MDCEGLAGREKVGRGAERVGDDQGVVLGPPERGLAPLGKVDGAQYPERRARHVVAGSHVQRDVVAGGERGRVPPVPVEELDHTHDPSGGGDPLVERRIVDGVDEPHAPVVHERVRGALEARRLVGDPAEAERELVAEARSHAEAARIGR